MHSKRLRVGPTDGGLSITRATNLRAYLDQLVDNLDNSSLRAVLKLMISKSHGAVRKQQQLIALERLVGREAAGRIDRLRELEAAQKQLTALYASHAESEDEGTDDHGLDEGAPPLWYAEEPMHGASARAATAFSVHAFRRLGTIGKEQGDYGGRFPAAAARRGELARAEPAPVCDRQGRHGAGPAR